MLNHGGESYTCDWFNQYFPSHIEWYSNSLNLPEGWFECNDFIWKRDEKENEQKYEIPQSVIEFIDKKKTDENINNDKLEDINNDKLEDTFIIDNIINYLKFVDLLKNDKYVQEEKIIREAKDKIEQILIDYLDKINEDYFQIGTETILTKIDDINNIKNENKRKYLRIEKQNNINI